MRLLADENLNGNIVRGLRHRLPGLDFVRAQDVGLEGADDPAVLAWAAAEYRIVVSHDKATMPDFAYARLARGEAMPGLVLLRQRLSVRQAIEQLIVFCECSEHAEWAGRMLRLPI